MQAEEEKYGYAYEFTNYDDDSDDDPDYGTKRKKKSQRRQKAKALEAELMPKQQQQQQMQQMQMQKATPQAQQIQTGSAVPTHVSVSHVQHQSDSPVESQGTKLPHVLSQEDMGYSATGRRKRKDTGATRTASRAWSDDEENRFKEALTLFGRDWKRCAEHIGTRDARAVASHTQKFLIKALLRGEELPEAMARSGKGYTLSGKPLDPNSSAARAYGLRAKEFLSMCFLTD